MSDFDTTNIYLASTLRALGYPMLDMREIGPRRRSFIFERTTRLTDDANEFLHGDMCRLRVEPNALFREFLGLKRELYEDNEEFRRSEPRYERVRE